MKKNRLKTSISDFKNVISRYQNKKNKCMLETGSILSYNENLGLDPFPDPVGHFGAPWWPFWGFAGGAALQAVSECPWHR